MLKVGDVTCELPKLNADISISEELLAVLLPVEEDEAYVTWPTFLNQ